MIRLRDLGVTALRGDSRGDILIEVGVEIPKKLSGAEKDLLAKFGEMRNEPDLRSAAKNAQHSDGGVFAKLREKFRDL